MLRIFGEAQEKLSVRLQLIDRVDGLVDLRVQPLNLLLTRGAQQEIVHLGFEGVVHLNNLQNRKRNKERLAHLHVDVVARRLFALRAPFHGDHVVDNDRVWGVEQGVQSLRNLRELHARTPEYLLQVFIAHYVFALVCILQSGKNTIKNRSNKITIEPVCFDVLPQGRNDHRSGLGVHPQQSGQTRVELELQGLII